MKTNILKITLGLVLSLVILSSCKKEYLDTKPSQSVSGDVLFESTDGAYIALNGIHALMVTDKFINGNHRDFGVKAGDLANDLMGQDIVAYPTGYDWFFSYYDWTASREPTNYGYIMWTFQYRVINNANAILDQIDNASGLQEEKDDIKGQALAYRAWSYLRLIQRFSKAYLEFDSTGAITNTNSSAPGVPLYTSVPDGDSKGNGRGTIQDIVDQMTADINAAIPLLETGVTHTEKSHISVAAAHGIAARIAMYKGEWAEARSQAADAISTSGASLMDNTEILGGMNDKNNSEFIWCSTMTSAQYNDMGIICWVSFFDENTPGYAGLTAVNRKITKQLYDTIPSTDIRKQWFESDYEQVKFTTADPDGFVLDNLYMRLAEMYLIAAEASAQLSDPGMYNTYMQDLLTNRNSASVTLPTSKVDMLAKVRLERRIELWAEGFSYTDLKERGLPLRRSTSGSFNHLLANCKIADVSVGDNWWTFKIPLAEINANDAITPAEQNP